jgi:hypothetical protein
MQTHQENQQYRKASGYKITATKEGREMVSYHYSVKDVTRRIQILTQLGWRYVSEVI